MYGSAGRQQTKWSGRKDNSCFSPVLWKILRGWFPLLANDVSGEDCLFCQPGSPPLSREIRLISRDSLKRLRDNILSNSPARHRQMPCNRNQCRFAGPIPENSGPPASIHCLQDINKKDKFFKTDIFFIYFRQLKILAKPLSISNYAFIILFTLER